MNIFLFFGKRSNKDYSKKSQKLLYLIKNEKAETAYDGDDFYNTEISSRKSFRVLL